MSPAAASKVFDAQGRFVGELLLRRAAPLYVVEVVDDLGRTRGESSTDGRVYNAAGTEVGFVSRRFAISRPEGGDRIGQVAPDGTIHDVNGTVWGRVSPMIHDRAVGGVALFMV